MSCGSASALADVIGGKTPQVDMSGLSLSRYAA
jgi:hypothetical protein